MRQVFRHVQNTNDTGRSQWHGSRGSDETALIRLWCRTPLQFISCSVRQVLEGTTFIASAEGAHHDRC